MDLSKLPPELVAKMREWESHRPENMQVTVLQDIASMVQEFLSVIDGIKIDTKDIKALGAVLDDSRQQLIALNKKDATQAEDYSQPIVDAVGKLSREITLQLDKINLDVPQPNVNVSAPEVKIDLTKIEKLLKTDIPKAFAQSISLIPEPEKTDNTDVLDKLENITTWLESIDKASRMKPQFPNQLKVVNPDGSNVGTGGVATVTNDGTFATPTRQDTTNTELGIVTETAPATDTASSGLNGRLQRIAQRLTSIIALLPGSLGQKARAASLAVTLSTEDITAITPPAAITGFATASNQTDKSQFTKLTDGTDTALITAAGEQNTLESNSGSIKTAVETIDNFISGSRGLVTEDNSAAIAASLSVLDDWDETDRAKVNSIVGQAGVAAGAGAVSASTQRMITASDSPDVASLASIDTKLTSPLTVGKKMGSSTTPGNVSTSTTVATLVSANASRIKATIYNDSATGILYIKEGAAASATSFEYALAPATATAPGGTLICDDYNGILTGILSTGTGTARVGET